MNLIPLIKQNGQYVIQANTHFVVLNVSYSSVYFGADSKNDKFYPIMLSFRDTA